MRAAAVYGRLGWAVVPLHDVTSGACSCGDPACRSAGKHPRLKAWQREASSDPAVIASWAASFPSANVGVATGSASGFFALDVDGDAGRASLEALLDEHGDLPETVQAQTGSGGTHYLFRSIGGVSNSASRLAPGLDVRGDGGQIVVAPSVSAKGAYRWIRAPWDTEIAEAPAWLLELLNRRPAAAPAATQRGYFPPASPAVLAAAREALERHGPAIEGNGGDEHTFRAGALLTHDFALTEDEAWPLLLEWNEECQPPWDEDALRAKLTGGAKYGTGAFGSQRAQDALAVALKPISDWRERGGPTLEIPALVAEVRAILARGVDGPTLALVATELSLATSVAIKALQLPAARIERERRPEDDGTIAVTPRLAEVADKAVKAITPLVFQRNGQLCEVAKTAERVLIVDLETARIQDLMSRAARWMREGDKGPVETSPPLPIASIVHARRGHTGVRVLQAVTTAPIFLADGSILQERGYNEQARLWLEPSVSVSVPDAPDRAAAVRAIHVLRDLLSDFHFHEQADFSTWVAALLTPLVKAAIGNAPAPLVCVSASSPGAGKTLLTDVLARVVTGGAAEVRPYNPKDPGEWGKRITAFVRSGTPVNVFDNVNGAFGDEAIDRLITSSTWSDRILGLSDAPPLPNVALWMATGNNIEPVNDTIRRVLLCRVEVDTERPQERSGFKRDPLADYALEHRAEFLTAALTILRAYHCAGRPRQTMPSWGSFTAWSDLVRGALVWTGVKDPFLTQRRAALELGEPDHEAHDFWLSVVDESDGTPLSIVTLANSRDARGVLNVKDEITTYGLRRFLSRFVDRPRAGQRIRRVAGDKPRYYTERISV